MSAGKDTKSGQPTAGLTGDAPIIDAEIVQEDTAAETATNASGKNAENAGRGQEKMKTVAPEKRSGGGKAGWAAAGILAIFAAGIFAAPYFQNGLSSLGITARPAPLSVPLIEQTGEPEDLAPLKENVATLQARLERHQEILAQQSARDSGQNESLEQLQADLALLASSKPGAALGASTPAEFAALKADIVRLTNDLARLSALSGADTPAVSQLTGALALARAEGAQLRARITALEASLQGLEMGALEASPRGRLILLLSRTRDRAFVGLDFSDDLRSLRVDIANLPTLDQQLMGAEIAVLQKASLGITPYAVLVRDYDAAVSAALRAGQKETGTFLTNLFTSRRRDAGATGDDAVFLTAERRLAARDVAGSASALTGLTGATATAIKPWLTAAETYAAVERAFGRLLQTVANAGPSGPRPSGTERSGAGLSGQDTPAAGGTP